MSRDTRFSHYQQIAARRERVLTWTAAGRHTHDVAAELNVNEVIIKRHLRYLMDMAKKDIKSYVEDKLPFEYMKSLATFDNIKKRAFGYS
jgi:FixJ family two-component response regulator